MFTTVLLGLTAVAVADSPPVSKQVGDNVTAVQSVEISPTTHPTSALLFDSGDVQPLGEGKVPFVDVWQESDGAADLATNVLVPIVLEDPIEITQVDIYAFNPHDPSDKTIDIYFGTNEYDPGELMVRLEFGGHTGQREGWNTFQLPPGVVVPAGELGFSAVAAKKSHLFWAANFCDGEGYAWATPSEPSPWFLGTETEFGFVPNFGLRIYGHVVDEEAAAEATGDSKLRLVRIVGERPIETQAAPGENAESDEPSVFEGEESAMVHVLLRRPKNGASDSAPRPVAEEPQAPPAIDAPSR